MNKKTIITISAVCLLLGCGLAFSAWLDALGVHAPEWYRQTDRYGKKSMLRVIAYIEESQYSPDGSFSPPIFNDPTIWGTPIIYSYENGEPTLRAAGKDRKLHTADDFVQKACITNQVTLRDDPHGQS